MGIVTALKQQARNPERVNLFLDGEFRLGISKKVAARLRVGAELSDADIEGLLDQEAFEAAFQRAIRLISRRPHSSEELRVKLSRKHVQEQVIERVIERLADSTLLDDREFADTWVENRMAFRPRSRKLLHQELRQKGISKTIIEEALGGFDEEQAAVRAAAKAIPRYRSLPGELAEQRLLAYLARRGFSYSLCRMVVKKTLLDARISVEESEVER
jgi:regulatory protein